MFVIVYAMTHSNFCFPMSILILIAVIIFLLLVHPYKEQFKFYNKIDIVLILSLVALLTGMIAFSIPFDEDEFTFTFKFCMVGILSLVPFLYLTVSVLKGGKQILTRCYIRKSYIMLDNHV